MYRTANIIAASIAAALIIGLVVLMGAAMGGQAKAEEAPAQRQWVSQHVGAAVTASTAAQQ